MAGMSWVINFANSVVGVGVLAMPYCFHQCGIILASCMILSAATMTKYTCEFLLRSASYTRKTTFEQIAFHIYGSLGKLITEIRLFVYVFSSLTNHLKRFRTDLIQPNNDVAVFSIIGLLLGTLVAFQVVIGDLAPAVIHNAIGLQESWTLRTVVMIVSCGVIIPISLMRNVSSLASLNAISMTFYMFFIFVIFCFSLPNLYLMDWWKKINFWRWSSFFHCLPIISISFTCQAQVLVMYSALPDPNMKTMTEIINKAINLVAGIYITVGIFGYISFFQMGVHGDILENFPHGFFTDGIKLGFWISVILSFPLIVFPVRAAINSLLFANKRQGVLHDVISSASDYIAPEKFTYITIGIVGGTLVIGILIPSIETVLSITGALVGTFLCFVFPSALYLMSGAKDHMKKLAQFILVLSSFCMVISTFSVLSGVQHDGPRPAHDVHGVPSSVVHNDGDKVAEAFVKATTMIENQVKVDEIKNKGVHQFDHAPNKVDIVGAAQHVDVVTPTPRSDGALVKKDAVTVKEDQAKKIDAQSEEGKVEINNRSIQAVEPNQDQLALRNQVNKVSHQDKMDNLIPLTAKPDVLDRNHVDKVQIRHQLSNDPTDEVLTESVEIDHRKIRKEDSENHVDVSQRIIKSTSVNETVPSYHGNEAAKEDLKKVLETENKINKNISNVVFRKESRPGRDILSS